MYNNWKKKGLKEDLQCSLTMPSTTHTYSVITEIIREWVMSKMPKNYFRHFHLEGKHVFDDFRSKDLKDVIKNPVPLIVMIPKINLEYNRDMLDTNMLGANMLMRTGRLDRALIRDFDRNLFIGTAMELLDLSYTFNMKVETKAQQIELYKYINTVFSIGHTTEGNVDLDYHLPYEMMLQFANDAGFEVDDTGCVKDILGYINYLNKISRLPIIFKYRTINGRMEFFMRFNDIDIRLDLTETVSTDDGERIGMLNRNFGLEMEIGVKAPSPKFFMYYSSNSHELISGVPTLHPDDITDTVYPIYEIKVEMVPKINEKGWNQYLTTDYYEEDINDSKEIDFSGLFQSGTDIFKVIEWCRSTGISPDGFIDFKLYNGAYKLVPYSIDWETVILRLEDIVETPSTHIAIYVDTEYVFARLKEMERMNTNRFIENE